MNVDGNANTNYPSSGRSIAAAALGGGGDRKPSAGSSSSRMTSVDDHIRQRYGPSDAMCFDASVGRGISASAAQQAAMDEYTAAAQHGHQFVGGMHAAHSGRAGLPPSHLAAGGGQFNPSMMYPHGAAVAAGLPHQGSPQPPPQGEYLMEYGGGEATAMSQAEKEEELLLNLLIARRQRQAMRAEGGGPPLPPGADGNPTTWTEDFMRLRRESNPAVAMEHLHYQMGSPYAAAAAAGGMSSSLHQQYQQQGEDTSNSYRSHARMGQMHNVPMGVAAAAAAAANQQYMSESARYRQQRRAGPGAGPGVFEPGGPQGGASSWMGNNPSPAAAAAMHNQPFAPRNESNYAQRPEMISNTPLGMDVLERADRMMPGTMYDARMPDQPPPGAMGYGHPMAGHQQRHLHPNDAAYAAYGKRSLVDYDVVKGMDKAMKQQQQQQYGQQGIQYDTMEEGVQPGVSSKKKKAKKKPPDMPRRPLSAYNLFFSKERERILREIEGKTEEDEEEKAEAAEASSDEQGKGAEAKGKPKALLRPLLPADKKRRPHRKTHGKISFQLLAQKVGQRWKALPDEKRKYYQDLAQEDMKRQKKAMEEYYQKRSASVGGAAAPEGIGE